MKKSLIALLLVVALVVTVSVFAVSAEETNPFEGQTGTVNAYCEHCKTTVDWTAVPQKQTGNLVQTGKHVHCYLQGDTTSGSRSISKDGSNICVNLNGFTWTRTATNANWQCVEGGEFNVMDTSVGQTGVMDAKHTTDKKLIYITAGTFNLYGGKLTRSVANSTSEAGAAINGGAVVMTGGTFNMYGGSIDTYTQWAGGAIHMKNAAFNFYGGTITGVSDGEAGGISVGANATVLVDGGTFDGCISKVAPNDNYNNGGGAIKLTAATSSLTMKSGTIKNCSANGVGGAVCNGVATFNMKGGTIEKCTAGRGGAVFVSGSASKILMSGGTIKNCTATEAGGALYIQYQSKGSEISGTALIDSCSAPNGGGIALGGSGIPAITVKGGTIQNCSAIKTSGALGGSIYDKTTGGAIVNIEGGTISGGSVVSKVVATENADTGKVTYTVTSGLGGNIYLNHESSQLNIAGATVESGSAPDGNGGNIYINKGALTITDGTVTKGTALRVEGDKAGNAGNIFMKAGTFIMEGGTISGGLETNNAAHCGNLYLEHGVVATITGGTITGGKCVNYGGNIYAYGAQLTIDAAEGKTVKITNGKAGGGGNLYIRENDTDTTAFTTITGPDVTVSGGNATFGWDAQCGSQIMLYGTATNPCTLTLTDVAINSDETHADEIALYKYAELNVGGTKNVDCAYIMDANSKVTVLAGYTGEMHVRWQDSNIGNAVVPGAEVDASLQHEVAYTGTGVIKACNASRTGKIASLSTVSETGFAIAGFGGFNYGEDGKLTETSLSALPTDANAYDFVRVYLNDGATIELAANTTLDINNGVFHVVTNGFELNLIESRTNELESTNGYVTVDDETKVNTQVKLDNGYQYIVLGEKVEGEATKFSSNRVMVDIHSVSIKPSSAGIYYETDIGTNAKVAPYAVSYGVVLSLADMPEADFVMDLNGEGKCENIYTEFDLKETDGFSNKSNSALLVGIMPNVKGALTQEGELVDSAEAKIYATAFMCIQLPGESEVRYIMADKNYSYSLMDIMEIVDADENLASHSGVVKMYDTWYENDMKDWGLTNIDAAWQKSKA